MKALTRLVVLAFTASSLLAVSPRLYAAPGEPISVVRSSGGGAVTPAASHDLYPASAKEAYLSPEQINYIRPGLKLKVNSVTIGADRRPVVDLTITDDFDQPLDRLGKVTPGVISISLMAAWWDNTAKQYTAYTTRVQTSPITGVSATQAGTDSNGTWTDVSVGNSKYQFRTALPATFDQTRTHTIGIYSTRNMTDIVGKNYYANVEYDFRPDGKPVTEQWASMTITGVASCANCHDPLSAHGGSRRDVKLCVMCHTPQTIDPDTGNTVDMKVMIHKIHRGVNLPSVKAGTPYVIIGNAQSVHDFSGVGYPQDMRNCQTCHEAGAADAATFSSRPTRAACGSCHDDVNWVTGANHDPGAQLDDTKCSECHSPQGDKDWDLSVKGAHVVPTDAKQLKGLKVEIVGVTDLLPDKKPTITFKLTNGDGSIVDPTTFPGNISFRVGGPTKGPNGFAVADFAAYISTTAKANAAGAFVGTFNGTLGTHVSTVAIPANAAGTWTVSADVRRPITLSPKPRTATSVNEAALNPIKRVVVSEAGPVARRTVVSIDKCNKCHERLALHGGQRLLIDECVICHNPNTTDNQTPVKESVDFKRMIHRIHTGEELTQIYQIGNGGFNEVLYPGDRRNCVTCHSSAATANLPVVAGAIDTPTLKDWYSPMGPGTTACLGCHDNRDAAAHAYINTATFGEACATCHGANSEWSVAKVHAR